jgi:4-hydroxy-2-oxovalerate aldolase
MFLGYKNGTEENIALAKKYNLNFLRVGANAGDGALAADVVRRVKSHGLVCRYSLMKAYVLSAEALADEAAMLEKCGLDEITIMDSAGTMMPHEVTAYVKALTAVLDIPVAFHGHNNLGLSVANAIAAMEAGATVFDCGLLGMARSAGNIPTELMVALLQQKGELPEVDFYGLMKFLDEELVPAMAKHGYKPALLPMDLILGLSGAHSSFLKTFRKVAEEEGVNAMQLVVETSKLNRRNPSEEQMRTVAKVLKEGKS